MTIDYDEKLLALLQLQIKDVKRNIEEILEVIKEIKDSMLSKDTTSNTDYAG